MPAAPRYKVFDPHGKYVASAKTPDLGIAAALVAGAGSSVRDGYKVKDTIFRAGFAYVTELTNLIQAFRQHACSEAAGLGPIRSVTDPAAAVASSSVASEN